VGKETVLSVLGKTAQKCITFSAFKGDPRTDGNREDKPGTMIWL